MIQWLSRQAAFSVVADRRYCMFITRTFSDSVSILYINTNVAIFLILTSVNVIRPDCYTQTNYPQL